MGASNSVVLLQMIKYALNVLIGFGMAMSVGAQAQAASFTLNPATTFEVGDGFFGGTFDGSGDADAVFPGNFDTVVLGTFGENSENAEFNLNGFSVPTNEVIISAFFQVAVQPNQVFGLGVSGQRPGSLGVRGYLGNGLADASDFEAGTLLDTAAVSPNYIRQELSFDVTNFVKKSVADQASFAGFGVRAQSFGGISLSGTRPTLVITTAPVPEPGSALAIVGVAILGQRLRRKITV
jgi:hypothetical protein